MNFRRFHILLPGLLFVALLGAGLGPAVAVKLATAEKDRIETAVRLFETCAANEAVGEYFSLLSPFCLEMNAAILYRGSAGTTRKQFARLLPEQNPQKLLQYNSSLLQKLKASGAVACSNEMEYDSSLTSLRRDFLRDLRQNGYCEIRAADFSALRAGQQWQVFKLSSELSFAGEWAYPFDPENVQESFQHTPDSLPEPCWMMAMHPALLEYHADAVWEAAFLPFKNSGFQLILLKPQQIVPRRELPSLLSAQTLIDFLERPRTEYFSIRMPKFNLSNQLELQTGLARLGIGLDDHPDFSNMYSAWNLPESHTYTAGMKIADLIQKNHFEVDERRVEARSVTVSHGIAIGCAASDVPVTEYKPPVLVMDRPFLFLLFHEPTRTILFIGSYECPKS